MVRNHCRMHIYILCHRKEKTMAKDQVEEQVNERVATPHMTAEELQTFLGSKVKSFSGLTITVDTRENPMCLKGGVISGVQLGSAWAGFTHDGIPYRTKEILHRNNFVSWIHGGGIKPFSAHRDFKDAVGPPNVCFMRMSGGN